ncbi:unnamed protein product [Alternaria alternata]
MDASTRLYKRLGEIPEDPNDPDSLDDLIVCAFGAFERYYVCWKTKGGEFKQDGYDLPPALRDWLYPTDGTTRDFASLQVVFGRGEEYFASDKNGKLEYKEPEVKKAAPVEDEEKLDRQALRRSRTVSFLRPLSETSIRSDGGTSDTNRSKRSSSISSQRASRPPSLSYTNSRTNSEISLLGETIVEGQTSQPTRPSYISQWTALGSSVGELKQVESPSASEHGIYGVSVVEPERDKVPTKTASPASVTTNFTAIPQDAAYYVDEDYDTPPVVMGRMSTYFSKPGYQLGDSLFSGYQPINWASGYEEVDDFGG